MAFEGDDPSLLIPLVGVAAGIVGLLAALAQILADGSRGLWLLLLAFGLTILVAGVGALRTSAA